MHIMSILFMLLFLSSVDAFQGHAGGSLNYCARVVPFFFFFFCPRNALLSTTEFLCQTRMSYL